MLIHHRWLHPREGTDAVGATLPQPGATKNPENPGKPGRIVGNSQFSPEIPSGKRLHNYGKSPFLMGKSTIILMAIFNSYVELPEGIRTRCHVFYSVTCEKTAIVSICFYMKWLDV